ncbi:MAG TPA: DUF1189 family protein [Phycisphaerae bacterium]|nr:DUF1189 family protein [Phycisphaerae bacterium]
MTQSPNSSGISPAQSPESQPPVPPRAPFLLKRIFLLIVDPEWWAKSAMYPYSATFWALFWVTVLTSIILAMTLLFPVANNFVSMARDFAVSYDHNYPPMLLDNGKLSFTGPRAKPGQFIELTGENAQLVIDPSGQAKISPPDGDLMMNVDVTQSNIVVHSPLYQQPQIISLADIQGRLAVILNLPANAAPSANQTPPVTLDSTSLTRIVNIMGLVFLFLTVCLGWLLLFLQQAIWSVLMIILVAPITVMVCRGLGMPLRVAYRIGTAVMVPVLVVSCFLESLKIISLGNQATDQWETFLQLAVLLSPIPIAIWAAMIANRLFGGTKTSRR